MFDSWLKGKLFMYNVNMVLLCISYDEIDVLLYAR